MCNSIYGCIYIVSLIMSPTDFKIIESMKSQGAKAFTIALAITTYAKRSLPEIVFNRSTGGIKSPISDDSFTTRHKQREIIHSIVDLLPDETQQSVVSINFLCYLLRNAILLEINSGDCRQKLEKVISVMVEHATVEDLLIVRDVESVRRIVMGFLEKEMSRRVVKYGDFYEAPSPAMVRVATTVDAYLREVARDGEWSILQFNGIANLVPKNVREVDDDLYRAIDVYLQVHPNIDEIAREKVCSVMDPLKLSVEARSHASQNKRLPLQIVLHTLYFDQLQIRSEQSTPCAQSMRLQVNADVRLAQENEKLRHELLWMRMYISDMEKSNKMGPKVKKPTFFSSLSKTLGKLNPFKQQGSKDTTSIDDRTDRTKPRRRRFSMS